MTAILRRLAAWLARGLRRGAAGLLALAQRLDAAEVHTLHVPIDDLYHRAHELVQQAEASAASGTTGVYKRTVMVEPVLLAEFKHLRSHQDISRAIEAVLSLKG